MTDDRLMIAEAVFAGKIGEEYLTKKEIDEIYELVADAAFEQEMEKAVKRGLTVFSEYGRFSIH